MIFLRKLTLYLPVDKVYMNLKKIDIINIHAFPSSIDKKHFEQARTVQEEPEDQRHIKGPKLGFYGVIDERFDIELIKKMANYEARMELCITVRTCC